MLLAIDTATDRVTVALHDGRRVLAEESSPTARAHTELLAPAIQQVCRRSGVRLRDLSGIAVGVGPGPFTGLRVGLVTARTLATVLGVEVVGVCTLDLLAAQAAAAGVLGDLLTVTDARRREVYLARYQVTDGVAHRIVAPCVVAAATASSNATAVGTGARAYPDLFPAGRAPFDPSAAALAEAVTSGLVELVPPDPLYLRRPDARPGGPRKRVLT